jgi:hypothetical protein
MNVGEVKGKGMRFKRFAFSFVSRVSLSIIM